MGCSARTPTGVGGSWVIAAADLVDGVRQRGLQDGEAVPHPAGGPRKVDDQCVPGDSGEPRESAAVGTFSRPNARMASAMPGTS